VRRAGGCCERFEGIHLVEESTTTHKTLEMLGFVDQADPYAIVETIRSSPPKAG